MDTFRVFWPKLAQLEIQSMDWVIDFLEMNGYDFVQVKGCGGEGGKGRGQRLKGR